MKIENQKKYINKKKLSVESNLKQKKILEY